MRFKYSILLFVGAVIGLSSCKNNDNNVKPTVSSFFGVANASADTINFYLNGTRQNNASSLFPNGWSGYRAVPAGMQNYQIKKAGSSTALFSIPLNLKDSTNNSLFVVGGSVNNSFFIADHILLDTIPFSTVRFVNAAPDAGSLTVFVGDTVNFAALAFKSFSGFVAVGSGQKEIKVYLAGAVMPKIDTIVAMLPGKAYTVFTKGLLNGKGSSVFDVGVILTF